MLNYDFPLYRPPSEARSLIIQITLGCSHNDCTFCNMYRSKRFTSRPFEDIKAELEFAREHTMYVRRIFLADGDAFVLSFKKLEPILKLINEMFPEVEGIGIYARSSSITSKSMDELKKCAELKVDKVYMGLESGDEVTLQKINKGETAQNIVKAGKMLKEAGLRASITVISGIGGKERSKEHAINTAKAINEINPDFLGVLSLLLEPGTPMLEDYENGVFHKLSAVEIISEMKTFLEHLDSPGTVFRCIHPSNYFTLMGTLNEDTPKMIKQCEDLLKDSSNLRDERFRQL